MADIAVTLILDNKEYLGGLNRADSATKGFAATAVTAGATVETSFNRLQRTVGDVATRLNGLRSVLVGVAFGALATSALQMADAISDLSKASGISVERILQLGNALQQSGGEAQNATVFITEFLRSIDGAAQGSAKAQSAFAKVGVTLNDLRTLTEPQLFDKAIAGLKRLGTGAEATAVGFELFGKSFRSVSGPDLAANINSITQDLRNQRDAIEAGARAQGELEKMIMKVKIAFLEAFRPALNLIGAVDGDTKTLANTMKVVAAVIAITYGAAAINGLRTFYTLTKALVIVLRAQAIAGAAALGFSGPKGWAQLIAGAAALTGVVYGLNKVLDDTADKSEVLGAGAGRGVQGGPTAAQAAGGGDVRSVLPAFAAQVAAVKDVGDSLARNNRLAIDRIDLETRLIGKSENTAEIQRGIYDIQKTGEEQVASLQKQRASAQAQGQGEVVAAIDAQILRVQGLTATQQDNFRKATVQKQAAIATERQQQEAIKNTIAVEGIRNQILGIQLTEVQKLANEQKTNARAFADKSAAEIAALQAQARARDAATASAQVELTNLETGRRLLDLQTSILGVQFSEMQKLEELKKSPAFLNKTKEEIAALEAQAKAVDATSVAFRNQALARGLGFQGEDFKKNIEDQMKLSTAANETERRQIQETITQQNALRDKLREIDQRYGNLTTASATVKAARDNEISAARSGYQELLKLNTEQIVSDQTRRESFSFGMEEAMRKYVESSKSGAEQARGYFETFAKGAEDALMGFVNTGKLSFRDLANSLIQEFARNEIKNLLGGLFGQQSGGGGSLVGQLFSSLFGGGKAAGGPVRPGKSYLVGERGPEMFTPGASGSITPNSAMSGQTTVVNYNINAADAASFKSMIARDPEFLYALTEKGRSSLPGGRR